MAAKAKGKAKRTAKQPKSGKKIPGKPLTAAQRKQIKEIMKLVELGVETLAQGVAYTRQTVKKQRR